LEGFFGKGTVGLHELHWFAVSTWNMAVVVSKKRKYDYSVEFFELAAEFFDSSNGEDDANCAMVCKSLILSVNSMLYIEELQESPLSDSDLKKGVEMLSRAGKVQIELSNYQQLLISLCSLSHFISLNIMLILLYLCAVIILDWAFSSSDLL
jgi:hypothetical protein